MSPTAHRPFAALTAVVAALAMVPLALSPSPAAAEPSGGAPGFAQIPANIPSAAAALRHAKAVVAGRAPTRDLTMTLRDLSARLPEYTGADHRFAKSLLARPNGGKQNVENSLGATWTGAEAAASPDCGTSTPICVHWTDTTHQAPDPTDVSPANGIPDQVDRTLAVMTHVWQTEVGTYGYRAPLTDQRGSINADGVNFDVYLSDIGGGGYYGYCAIDDSRKFSTYNFYDRSGYCVLDNDFSATQFPSNTPLQNLQVTAAHEFFHAVQFGYDAFEDPWFMEGTAAWIEDEVYNNVNDNRQYLQSSQMTHPGKPLDTSLGITVYGSWGFFRNLSEQFGRNIVRAAWNRADGSPTGPDDYSIQAVGHALAAQGTNLGTVFGDYARDNLAPANYYSEGAAYPSPAVSPDGLGGSHKSTGWLSSRIDHLSTAYQAVRPNGSDRVSARLRVKVDGPARSTGAQARVLVKYSNGSYASRRISLDRHGSGAVTVDFGRRAVDRVTVALVNASDRYTNCYKNRTSYSCGGGTPVDDNRTYWVKFAIA